MRSLLLCSLAAALVCLAAKPAAADPIGPDGCANDSCQGAIYWLEYDPTPVGSTVLGTLYEVHLRIDTTGYDGIGVRIDDVAFKISPNLAGISLLDAPGDLADWTKRFGGINGDGCEGNIASGFGCATAKTSNVATLPYAGIYEWIFVATIPTGESLFTDPFEATIMARYVNRNGRNVGLVSEPITLQIVPEPTTLVLLTAGLSGLAIAGRRRA